jgi:hypothetical protein
MAQGKADNSKGSLMLLPNQEPRQDISATHYRPTTEEERALPKMQALCYLDRLLHLPVFRLIRGLPFRGVD